MSLADTSTNISHVHNVISVRMLTNDTFCLKVDRRGLTFVSGQCVSVGLLNQSINREYSIYSGENDDYLEFLIRIIPGGVVSEKLAYLKPGDSVRISGPYSDFGKSVNQINPGENYLFIATGTGIAPFRSIIKTSTGQINYTLLHGIRHTSEKYDHEEYLSGKYIPCISQKYLQNEFNGRVTDKIRDLDFEKYTSVLICGNRMMISDVYDFIHGKLSFNRPIYSEAFF